MAKKENLPLACETIDMEPGSSITYASEVVAIIAGIAAAEVEGIAGMVNVPNSKPLSKNRSAAKGVKVEIGTEEAGVDLYVTVEYGKPIQKAAQEVQESVRRAIEAMTGLHVVRVDVHVQGVSFAKENSALSAGAKNANLEVAQEEAPAQSAGPAPAEEAPAAEAQPMPAEPIPAEESAAVDAAEDVAEEEAEEVVIDIPVL